VVLVRCAVRAAAPPSLSDYHALTLTARNSERRYRRRYTLYVYPSPVPSYYHIGLILHTCVVVCMNVALHQETPLRLLLRTKCLKLPSARRVHGTRGLAGTRRVRASAVSAARRPGPRAPRARRAARAGAVWRRGGRPARGRVEGSRRSAPCPASAVSRPPGGRSGPEPDGDG